VYKKKIIIVVSLLFAIGLSAKSLESSGNSQYPDMDEEDQINMINEVITPQRHEELSKQHTKAAKCLRSDKPYSVCMKLDNEENWK
jgi:hypothetical protein